MEQRNSRPIELLAPARNSDIAIEAIKHGADAVYIGASSFGARSAATNSIDDITKAVDYAHRFGCRVYCTVNTIVYDNELKDVERLIKELYRRDVDALIVQDLGILRMDLPPIALHASTQCDTRDAAKAKFLENAGFSQIVLARELTLDEISSIRDSVSVPLEAFVHGALCVSYSGDCQASFVVNGRSANRGECAQMCRLPYDLIDGSGNVIPVGRGRHLLSLKDMNRSERIAEMLEAGVSSFKIEGRLKDATYVKNVVGAYRKIIDTAISASPGSYRRSSLGTSKLSFTPDLAKSFNRGYTDYFLNERYPVTEMASMASPKSVGETVGKVSTAQTGMKLKISALSKPLHNGDGLGYFDNNGNFQGFRLNKIEGNYLFPATRINIPAGAAIYRNSDKRWNDIIDGNTAKRTIGIEFVLRQAGKTSIALDAKIRENGLTTSSTIDVDYVEAHSPQNSSRLSALSKLGETAYSLISLDDRLGMRFIPLSILTSLRRKVVNNLDRSIRLNHRYDYRRSEIEDAESPTGELTTYHDNISNRLSEKFYRDHGVKQIERSIETHKKAVCGEQRVVMTTRYCLRRELGCCLKSSNDNKLPANLYLRNGRIVFKLIFNCKKCEMQLLTFSSKK